MLYDSCIVPRVAGQLQESALIKGGANDGADRERIKGSEANTEFILDVNLQCLEKKIAHNLQQLTSASALLLFPPIQTTLFFNFTPAAG